jgi:pimeloyl-ACP methyl ester carboxylesterase
MRHLGIETAILAGHDLGGGVAQIAAIRNPGLCSGLFLTNAIGYDNWPIASVKALRASGAAMRHLPNALFKLLLATFYHRGHDDSEKAQAAYDTHAPYYLRADGAAALVRQVQSLDVNDTLAVADRLKDLRIPARIVWGAADGFLKLEYGKRFARDLKAPLLTIKGGKHFTPEDHPESISQELMALVQQVRSFE